MLLYAPRSRLADLNLQGIASHIQVLLEGRRAVLMQAHPEPCQGDDHDGQQDQKTPAEKSQE